MSPSIASRQAPGEPMAGVPRSLFGASLRPQTTPPSHPRGACVTRGPQAGGGRPRPLWASQSALLSLRSDPGALAVGPSAGCVFPRGVSARVSGLRWGWGHVFLAVLGGDVVKAEGERHFSRIWPWRRGEAT